MKSKKFISTEIKLDELQLDDKNPRFAELYSGSKSEDDLIKYLLNNEGAKEIAEAIVKVDEFYPDKPLWVIKNKEGKYLVKDGNRRCAAVKALQQPGKYSLNFKKFKIETLPVNIYNNETDLDKRIAEEHTSSIFKKWDRIAKALEAYRLNKTGSSDSIFDIDSKPGDLIKLASFYHEAVKIGGEDFKKLLRSGRTLDSGRTIIFERLFRDRKSCGYEFKSSPSFDIKITSKPLFDSYIKALIQFLNTPQEDKITAKSLDKKEDFINELIPYGFKGKFDDGPEIVTEKGADKRPEQPKETTQKSSQSISTTTNKSSTKSKRTNSKNSGSVKVKPVIGRKDLPSIIKSRVDEYFDNLNSIDHPNAKIAMARVTFECVLKFVVESTKFSGNQKLYKSNELSKAYQGYKTNFSNLSAYFSELITDRSTKSAFKQFDLEKINSIVHNWKDHGVKNDADQYCMKLIELIEFLLQDEQDLLDSLDLTKLK